jgi:hypothetical protein
MTLAASYIDMQCSNGSATTFHLFNRYCQVIWGNTSTLQTLRTVFANEGFLALYNGFLPHYICCGGHTVAMFFAVQIIRDYCAGT